MFPKIGYTSLIMFTVCVLATGTYAQAQQLAFPGAEGFGRFAQGGRGGAVLHVTNLDDSGPGSFREAATASGPRTIVFDVSGYISSGCTQGVVVYNPYLTIAGQTAPSPGVTLQCPLIIGTHDVIIRHLRIRPGGTNYHPGMNPETLIAFTTVGDSVGYSSIPSGCCSNNIFDHMSFSWAPDDLTGVYGNVNNVTYQWNFIAEGITNGGKQDVHSKGFLIGSNRGNGVTFHHNIIAHNSDRNPFIHGSNVDFVNNLVYDWYASGTLAAFSGPVLINAVGNYYLRGPNSLNFTFPIYRPFHVWGYDGSNGVVQSYADESSAYFSGNIEPLNRPDNSRPELDAVYEHDGTPNITTTRINFPLVNTTDAFQAKTDVMNQAGARLPAQDAVDSRILTEIANGTGQYVNNDPTEVGGFPPLAQNVRPAGLDTDRDGMPDSWELAHGLDPNNPADGARDAGDGYTNLEKYLNDTQPEIVTVLLPAPKNLRVGTIQ